MPGTLENKESAAIRNYYVFLEALQNDQNGIQRFFENIGETGKNPETEKTKKPGMPFDQEFTPYLPDKVGTLPIRSVFPCRGMT